MAPKKKPPPRVDGGPVRHPPAKPRGRVVERREIGGVVYQLEWVCCGKGKCHCMSDSSPGHGPYWYGYRLARTGGGKAAKAGRWVSVYIGAEFREI